MASSPVRSGFGLTPCPVPGATPSFIPLLVAAEGRAVSTERKPALALALRCSQSIPQIVRGGVSSTLLGAHPAHGADHPVEGQSWRKTEAFRYDVFLSPSDTGDRARPPAPVGPGPTNRPVRRDPDDPGDRPRRSFDHGRHLAPE